MTQAGLLHHAHPYTVPTLTLTTALLAILLPAPFGSVFLYAGVIGVVLLGGAPLAALHALWIAAPLWFFLILILAVQGDPGPDPFALLGLTFSRAGLRAGIAQGARLGAIITMTLAMVQTLTPSRLLDSVAAGGGRRRYLTAFLAVSTLHTIHRFRQRASAIVAAQRSRGLRLRGSPVTRVRALGPLIGPLLLAALIEVDDRAVALETRGATSSRVRTPLDPPHDSLADRWIRLLALLSVVLLFFWRIFR